MLRPGGCAGGKVSSSAQNVDTNVGGCSTGNAQNKQLTACRSALSLSTFRTLSEPVSQESEVQWSAEVDQRLSKKDIFLGSQIWTEEVYRIHVAGLAAGGQAPKLHGAPRSTVWRHDLDLICVCHHPAEFVVPYRGARQTGCESRTLHRGNCSVADEQRRIPQLKPLMTSEKRQGTKRERKEEVEKS